MLWIWPEVIMTTQTELTCIGCSYHCPLTPSSCEENKHCEEIKFSVWPEKNAFLVDGIKAFLKDNEFMALRSNYLFLDFSPYNVKYFIDFPFTEHLQDENLNIIIISDKSMLPLAYYWKRSLEKSSSCTIKVVSVSSSSIDFERKFLGHGLEQNEYYTNRVKLTAIEVVILRHLLQGLSFTQLAGETELGLRRIYSIKRSLQAKMGGKSYLNRVISCAY